MREVNNNELHYHLRVADSNEPGNHASPVMANQDTFAVPCDREKDVDVIEKKQVKSLSHIKQLHF